MKCRPNLTNPVSPSRSDGRKRRRAGSMGSPHGVARRARGFALVVSLSLMVLLTVLAVGLLSLSTISLRSTSRGEAVAVARANARMALSLAIG